MDWQKHKIDTTMSKNRHNYNILKIKDFWLKYDININLMFKNVPYSLPILI